MLYLLMIKEIKELLDSDISEYQIYKETGVSQSTIGELRSGKRKLENITLKVAEKLYDFYKNHYKNS